MDFLWHGCGAFLITSLMVCVLIPAMGYIVEVSLDSGCTLNCSTCLTTSLVIGERYVACLLMGAFLTFFIIMSAAPATTIYLCLAHILPPLREEIVASLDDYHECACLEGEEEGPGCLYSALSRMHYMVSPSNKGRLFKPGSMSRKVAIGLISCLLASLAILVLIMPVGNLVTKLMLCNHTLPWQCEVPCDNAPYSNLCLRNGALGLSIVTFMITFLFYMAYMGWLCWATAAATTAH